MMNSIDTVPERLQKLRNQLVQISCSLFEINETSLYTSRRHPNAEIRFCIYKLLHDAGFNYCDVGRAMKKDHSTVMYGCKYVEDNLHYHFNKHLDYMYTALSTACKDENYSIVITNKKQLKEWLTISAVPEEFVTTLMDNVDMLMSGQSFPESSQSLSG